MLKTWNKSLSHNIFLSDVNMTTHFLFQPRTDPSRLFTWSLSFWAMLMGAAYTANLASFLVVERSSSVLHVTSLSEAIQSQLKLCVLAAVGRSMIPFIEILRPIFPTYSGLSIHRSPVSRSRRLGGMPACRYGSLLLGNIGNGRVASMAMLDMMKEKLA